MEYTPLNEFYNVRIYFDANKQVILYYFDISKENGIENNISYYDDLYLDVIYCPDRDEKIKIEDADELLDALDKKLITKEEYDLANDTCNKIITEIENKNSKIINMDKKKIIEKYFD